MAQGNASHPVDKASTNRFYTLDAMRGIAAFAVVFYHIGQPNPLGYLAVDLFFILSGFVLCHAYAGHLAKGQLSIAAFMRARFIRLYPLFAAGVVVGLLIRGGNPAAFLFVPDWNRAILYPMNTALWSVAYEMVASIGFALFFRSGARGWFAFWLFSGLVWGWTIWNAPSASVGMHWDGLVAGMARMTFAFTTGIALHWLFKRIGRQVKSNAGWLVCLAPFTLTFIADLPLLPALMIILPLIVLAGALVEVPQTRIATISGDLSYPVYAIHLPIVAMFGWASVPFVVMLAWVLDRFYDRPVRAWLSANLRTVMRVNPPLPISHRPRSAPAGMQGRGAPGRRDACPRSAPD